MKKYLYIFNYPPEDHDLCALEFKYLFHEEYRGQYYLTNQDICQDDSVFIKAKIDIFAMSENFDELLKEVKALNYEYPDFKVIYVKNKMNHVEYRDSLKKCKDLSWMIEGTVKLNQPLHTIALTYLNNMWICGYYHHGIPAWKKHDNKPWTFSNSLDIRLARTLVNIASGGDKDLTIIDPCCGMGTVVLEGLALGLNIEGYDISREISWHARKNLEYYGYDGQLIQRKDIHDHTQVYDVAIMDIPYNLYTPITYEEQCSMIQASRKICKKMVMVTFEDMTKEIEQAGYKIIDCCLRKKTEYVKFGRYIYVCN